MWQRQDRDRGSVAFRLDGEQFCEILADAGNAGLARRLGQRRIVGTPAVQANIAHDERGGWSSDRPRRDGAPQRPADMWRYRATLQVRTVTDIVSPGEVMKSADERPEHLRRKFAQQMLAEPVLNGLFQGNSLEVRVMI